MRLHPPACRYAGKPSRCQRPEEGVRTTLFHKNLFRLHEFFLSRQGETPSSRDFLADGIPRLDGVSPCRERKNLPKLRRLLWIVVEGGIPALCGRKSPLRLLEGASIVPA